MKSWLRLLNTLILATCALAPVLALAQQPMSIDDATQKALTAFPGQSAITVVPTWFSGGQLVDDSNRLVWRFDLVRNGHQQFEIAVDAFTGMAVKVESKDNTNAMAPPISMLRAAQITRGQVD